MGGGFAEVQALGTAMKKMAGLSTKSPALISQAIIRNCSNFLDQAHELGKLQRQGEASVREFRSTRPEPTVYAPDSPPGRAVIDSASRKMCFTCGKRLRTVASIRSTAFSNSCDDSPGRN